MEAVKFYALLAFSVLLVAGILKVAFGIDDVAVGCSIAAGGVTYGFCKCRHTND